MIISDTMETGKLPRRVVSYSMDEAVIDDVEAFADRFGQSRSEAIQLLVRKALGKVPDNEMERLIMESIARKK